MAEHYQVESGRVDGKTTVQKLTAAAFALLASVAMTAPAAAQPNGRQIDRQGYNSLSLSGLSVDAAKRELANDGYHAYRSIKVDGRQFDLWVNARARNGCIGFSSYNGRVTEARGFSDSDCGLLGGQGRRIDESNLRGLRVDDAKRSLKEYGYSNTRNVRIEGQQWDLWQTARGWDCIGFTSFNGRITAARSFRGKECEGSGVPGNGGWFNANDLRGLSVDGAKRSLANAGFRGARSIKDNGKQWDLWYDDSGRAGRCVGFTSYNGRVTDADEFSPRDCG